MAFLAILVFLASTLSIGYVATSFAGRFDDALERFAISLGLGLAGTVLLLILFNQLRIPLDWRILLGASLLFPAALLVKTRRLPAFRLAPPKIPLKTLLAFLLFALTLFMYLQGAFATPFLEDDDPWSHASGVSYVSHEKRAADPHGQFVYIDPYPPGYDALMGVLHQLDPSIIWVLKFFNALIAALTILFFYFFSKHFFKNGTKALYATIVLAFVPSFLSHFIWAHTLVVALFLISLYCFMRIPEHPSWTFLTMIPVAGFCLVQPSQPIKFFILFSIALMTYWAFQKRFPWKHALSLIGGVLISLIWWAPRISSFLSQRVKQGVVYHGTSSQGLWGKIVSTFPPNGGTATRAYTFSDFFFARSANMINNPIGLGIAISLLTLFAVLLFLLSYQNLSRERRISWMILLGWALFTFLGINTVTFHLPLGLFAFRFWMLFSIFAALLSAESISFLVRVLHVWNIPKIATIAALVLLLFFTAGQQKYAVNTAPWGPGGGWTSMQEFQGYLSLLSLPPGTPVFTYGEGETLIGLDAFDCIWCDEVVEFKKDALSKNATELHAWLTQQGYSYLVVSPRILNELQGTYGNKTPSLVDQRVNELASSPLFPVSFQSPSAIIFSVS